MAETWQEHLAKWIELVNKAMEQQTKINENFAERLSALETAKLSAKAQKIIDERGK